MKTQFTNTRRRAAGLTMVDVLVVIAALVILAGLLLPRLARTGRKGCYIKCISNVKQIGLSFKMWAGDNGDRYPMQVSTNFGGTLEVAHEAWRTFQVMSNELSDAKILICPQDSRRTPAYYFTNGLGNQNVSFFVGLDAQDGVANTILVGDRNLTNGLPWRSQVMTVASNSVFGWNKEMHNCQGNLGLADGSAYQLSNRKLREYADAALAALAEAKTNFPPGTTPALRLALP